MLARGKPDAHRRLRGEGGKEELMSGFIRPELPHARKTVAVVFVVAALTGAAALYAWPGEDTPAKRPSSVVIVPFVMNGRVDENMTKEFLDTLSSGKGGWHLVEGSVVAGKLPKGKKFASHTEVDSLRKAATAAGVEALILGRASGYKVLDAPGVKLRLSMLNAKDGEELYKKEIKASAWSSKGAKLEAAEDAAKKLNKDFKSE